MLTLTKKTEYALMALCHLARNPSVVSAREMAEAHGMPLPLLMNILKQLGQAGVVRSARGAAGGYSLAAAPDRFSLADLIEAVEGPVRFVRCADGIPDSCDLACSCTVRLPLTRVHEKLKGLLTQITLAQLADGTTASDPITLETPRMREHETNLPR